ncbi:MAG: hypothetical protein H6628_03905 [Calditrichae bacterium]|nr:hypothetical protein [Calditrichia bacterium]
MMLLLPVLLFGQLRTQAEMPEIRDAISKPAAGLLAGFLSSERFFRCITAFQPRSYRRAVME